MEKAVEQAVVSNVWALILGFWVVIVVGFALKELAFGLKDYIFMRYSDVGVKSRVWYHGEPAVITRISFSCVELQQKSTEKTISIPLKKFRSMIIEYDDREFKVDP